MAKPEKQSSDTSALRGEILEDARKRAEREIRAAERDADELLSRAKESAAAAEREILAEAKTKADRQSAIALASLPLERERMDLRAREDVIQSVFSDALVRLAEAGPDERKEAIRRLALAAAHTLKRGKLLLRVSENDLGLLDEAFFSALSKDAPDGLTFAVGPKLPKTVGGVLIETEDETELFNNTFEARQRRLNDALRVDVASRLWKVEE
ncbi:MAG: V-type ATP synthase subunit E family protein [Planctomycetota bacterium]